VNFKNDKLVEQINISIACMDDGPEKDALKLKAQQANENQRVRNTMLDVLTEHAPYLLPVIEAKMREQDLLED